MLNLEKQKVGKILLFSGMLAIGLQILSILIFIFQTRILDVVPADKYLTSDEMLYFSLLLFVGIPCLVGLLFAGSKFKQSHLIIYFHLSRILFVFLTFILLGSLIFGGGWYIGSALSVIGAWIYLYSIQENRDVSSFEKNKKDQTYSNRSIKKPKILGLSLLAILIASSAVLPTYIKMQEMPASLIPAYYTPPTGIEPNHNNIFWILPIWEWQGSDYEYGIAQLEYMKSLLGGPNYNPEGFIRVGRSLSCWYTGDLYDNGSYNPTNMIHALNMSAITKTPILFHMNGGNWGGCCTQHPVVQAMRENASNCQWDQKDVCHPIRFVPGPNDRFWGFAPNTDWEQFRERNIKQALSVIYEWSQENPGLLVGFSTDSEIHLNYNKFTKVNEGGYRSYFDYNPLVIEQYRFWASSNWSLDAFNSLCGTNFPSWAEVDAPRDDSVIGKIGNSWWETWTDFRVWHVWEAARRQSSWIHDMGFPRDMIWNHQILSEPNSVEARYSRADPIETAVNEYCKLGVTRYGWLSPEVWHSLGELALKDGSGDEIPSWGIFEWNLWKQHEYWAYREMLNSIYQYGGHVICPNEWVNCSINEGLWIPGDPCEKGDPYEKDGITYGSSETGCIGTPGKCCCVKWDESGCLQCVDPHGNPHFIKALQDFIEIGKEYPRGTCHELRVDAYRIAFYSSYNDTFNFYLKGDGLYIMAGIWLLGFFYLGYLSIKYRKEAKKILNSNSNLER